LDYINDTTNLPKNSLVEAGRMTCRIGDYSSDWSILLDTRSTSANLILTIIGATGTTPEITTDEISDPFSNP
jgi:hypothetical protein